MNVRIVPLGDVSAVSAGQGAPQRREAFGHVGMPFIRASSLDALCDDGSFSSLERIDEFSAKEHKLRLYAPGTVVFAKSGMSATKNRIYRLSRPAYVVNHLAAVVPSEDLDSVFLRYWLEHFNPTRLIQDSSYPSISQENIESVLLSLPTLSEQKRIAAQLEHADSLRRTRRFAIELSDSLLPAAFIELFGDPVKNKHCWQTAPLRKMCDNITDGTHDTPDRVAAGIPFITSKNIRSFEIDLTDLDFVTPETHHDIIKRCNPRFGDVLYTNIGANVGNAVANRLRFEFSLKNVALIQPDFTKLDSAFLEALLNNSAFKESILRVSSVGGAQKFIALEVLRDIVAIFPPLPLQQKFAALVERHIHLRANQREALRQAEHLFQTLLHRAFSEGM